MARVPSIFWVAAAVGAMSDGSSAAEEVRAFHGSSEHGLVMARGRIQAGERAFRRRRYAQAATDLREGGAGLENAFDRLSGLEEIIHAYFRLAQAELLAGHRGEAQRAAEALACLAPDFHLPEPGQPRQLLDLLASARRRVKQGSHGTLRITSVVKGQAFFVDGMPRGTTPESLVLPVGRHFVLVATPLGEIPYRVDLAENAELRLGQGEPEEETEEAEGTPAAGSVSHAARRPVLPHRH